MEEDQGVMGQGGEEEEERQPQVEDPPEVRVQPIQGGWIEPADGGTAADPAPAARSVGDGDQVNPDALLEAVGSFGAFQRTWYLLLCLLPLLTAYLTMAAVFTTAQPDHRCAVPGCDSAADPRIDDAFDRGFARFALPRDAGEKGGFSRCRVFPRRAAANASECEPDDFDRSAGPEDCPGGYVYDRSVYLSTVATEWGLFCSEGEVWKCHYQ